MRRIIEIVDRPTYDKWIAEQKSFYKTSIRGTDADPNKGKRLLPFEVKLREKELNKVVFAAFNADSSNVDAKTIRFQNVYFTTGSGSLEDDSFFELDYVAKLLNKDPSIKLEVSGHTDNIGDVVANRVLSQQRAAAVKQRLVEKGVSANRLTSVGYGDSAPIDTNDTDEGKANNRRTELKVVSNL